MPLSVYPFKWAFGLFSLFDYYEISCYEHLCASVSVDIYFRYSRLYPAGSYGNSLFNFLSNCEVFYKELCHLTF